MEYSTFGFFFFFLVLCADVLNYALCLTGTESRSQLEQELQRLKKGLADETKVFKERKAMLCRELKWDPYLPDMETLRRKTKNSFLIMENIHKRIKEIYKVLHQNESYIAVASW